MDIANMRRVTFEMILEAGLTTQEQIDIAMSGGADAVDAIIVECLQHLTDEQIEFMLARVSKRYYEKFIR